MQSTKLKAITIHPPQQIKVSNMKKSEIIAIISAKHNITLAKAKAIHDDIFGLISDSLTDGNRLRVKDFGTLEPAQRAQRMGRDPRNGQQITIEAAKTVKFKPSKHLKHKINAKKSVRKAVLTIPHDNS